MGNFEYIKELGLNDLYGYCSACESNQQGNPEISAIYARKALEWLAFNIYDLKHYQLADDINLYEMVTGEPFVSFIDNEMLMKSVHYIRKTGNNAAHSGKGVPKVTEKDSFFCLFDLYKVTGAIMLKLQVVKSLPPFDKTLIPGRKEVHVAPPTSVAPAASPVLHQVDITTVENTPTVELKGDEITEYETRIHYIDLMLKEAGWDVLTTEGAIQPLKACIEVEVEGMPSYQGVGYADYVLFGANGKPLALIEAKRTSKSANEGRHQAELYAKCLEDKYGVKPVIYYSNGYETYVIDRLGFPSRRIYAFHTAKDLELLVQRQSFYGNHDPHEPAIMPNINTSITDRHYQMTAVKSVFEWFNGRHRRALLVMATGTGKTRTAISLVDVLMRYGSVKNVLFLADRTSLVKQAHKNFVKLLPDTTTCVLNEGPVDSHDMNARIMFSTYQTMINYIDTDEKPFSVGRFDLVIVDEAHRSVFGKYGAIFSYFDSLLVGLTATPREEVDHSTYELFELEQGEPTSAYELSEAVSEGYLVNYKVLPCDSKIMRSGIKWADLSEKERQQLDTLWEYEKMKKALDGIEPRDIKGSEIFTYIYSTNTIDKVLQELMKKGLKVQSGDRIGKTIIFAYNHKHAEKIVDRFQELYPEYGEGFCALIDNQVNWSQDLIDKFEIRDGEPQIAVSVDMLDTGIDVPDALNLVFFKIVKSRIKFQQMIGRGTRLSPDIFGQGKDKEYFLIFDWCRNFEFFNQNPEGVVADDSLSLTERLFNMRTDIAFELQKVEFQEDEFAKGLHDKIKADLMAQVQSLNELHISVKQHWQAVSHFKNEKNWEYLSAVDVVQLKDEISPLLPKSKEDESSKKFDLLAFSVELSMLNTNVNATNSKKNISTIAEHLKEKASLPQVMACMGTLKEVTSDVFWENLTLKRIEKVRLELRDLLKFLFSGPRLTFDINIADTISIGKEQPGVFTTVTYKQKVIDYLAEHRDLPVLQKIQNVEPLTHNDILELERILWKELGTKEDYEKYTKNMICGDAVAVFIRSMVGVNHQVALQRYTDFITDHYLNSQQEEYLKTIINYVCENGDVTVVNIVNDPPFDDFDWMGIFGEKMLFVRKYVEQLHQVIQAPAS